MEVIAILLVVFIVAGVVFALKGVGTKDRSRAIYYYDNARNCFIAAFLAFTYLFFFS